ncbi:flavin-nucleotide-binding protein-like protein [Natronococcus amylolyticus DSM 10524]|uniref:Flavin-nucleotide-binding protein-like protein n=1 Tax=Natronococcus amylolyticus DSM 10524 TaxID=1227497 RepID=L9X304_9EURY|nr:pyridoxamine 5'-phosphate oxidase family protein [Natronococcus amylolyticus]ELY56090.1 flavin-nucleotide-binding protein-like protein [Natronococcus amylolyticus DSM 10524]
MSVDELREYGLVEMDDSEIRNFLSTRKTGVLGLPNEGAPYLLPLSFGYDGDSRLYFTYLLGSNSRKEALTERAESASFLAFSIDTAYSWESVLLSGRISTVSESSWDELEDVLADAWRPSLLESASHSGKVAVYEFRVDEQTGIKHQGLPPAFEPADE